MAYVVRAASSVSGSEVSHSQRGNLDRPQLRLKAFTLWAKSVERKAYDKANPSTKEWPPEAAN